MTRNSCSTLWLALLRHAPPLRLFGGHNILHRGAKKLGSMAVWDSSIKGHVLMIKS